MLGNPFITGLHERSKEVRAERESVRYYTVGGGGM